MAWEGIVQDIEISKLKPMDLPFRITREDELEGLVASIAEQGIIHPLTVRPRDGYFEVVAGNRRLMALRRLGRRKAPCVVMDLDDRRAFELALVENLQRRSLNPLEEALAFRSYVEGHGYGSESELARRIGKSQEYVSRRLQLLRLPPKVQEEVMRRRIPPSTAAELVALDSPDRMEQAAELIVERGLKRQHVRQMVMDERVTWFSEDPSERNIRRAERIMNKCITALKVALVNMDDAIEEVKDDWLLYEMLLEHRARVHEQIDELIRLKKHSLEQLVA